MSTGTHVAWPTCTALYVYWNTFIASISCTLYYLTGCSWPRRSPGPRGRCPWSCPWFCPGSRWLCSSDRRWPSLRVFIQNNNSYVIVFGDDIYCTKKARLGCPRTNQFFFSSNRNLICFSCFSVCFAKPKNCFFGLFRFVSVFQTGIETTETKRTFLIQTKKFSKTCSLSNCSWTKKFFLERSERQDSI